MFSAGNLHLMSTIKTHEFLLFQFNLRQDYIFLFGLSQNFKFSRDFATFSLKDNVVLENRVYIHLLQGNYIKYRPPPAPLPRHEYMFSSNMPSLVSTLSIGGKQERYATHSRYLQFFWEGKINFYLFGIPNQTVLVTLSECLHTYFTYFIMLSTTQ